jgi:hypothetical protein
MRRAKSDWTIAVVILLIAVHAAGCSPEKQTASGPTTPVADLSAPAEPTLPPQTPAAHQAEPTDHAELPAQDEPTDQPGSLSLKETMDHQPPPVDGDTMLSELGYVSPSDKVRNLLADPPGAKRLSQQSPLWVDMKAKRVFVDGYVAQREAYLEMFACPAETKEHESIVGVVAKSSELHAALLAVGAEPGTPVRFDTEYVPATGQPIRIWVMWYDGGEFHHTDARRWVRHVGTEKSLELDWLFVGSSVWKDPVDGKAYYQADGGEMICVSNFSTALMDLPVESSDANNELQFDAFTDRIPPPGTPVRLMLVPIPPSADAGVTTASPPAPDEPPTIDLMPLKPTAG